MKMLKGKTYVADIVVIRETKLAVLVKLAVNDEQFQHPVTTWLPKSEIAYWPEFNAIFVADWLLKKFEFTREVFSIRPRPTLTGRPFGLKQKRIVHWKELL